MMNENKSYNILFIENYELNKQIFKNILKEDKYNISFVDDEEKLKEIKNSLKYFCTIVCSNIKNFNRIEETLNFIKENSTNTNLILILDIKNFQLIEDKIDNLPIYHFLIRPFNINEFKFLITHASYDFYLKNENEKLLNNLKQINFILQQQKLEITKNFIQLKELQEELIKKEKLSALGVFTSSVLHDIKNSLGIINGYTEIIHMKDPSLSNYTNKIQDEVSSLVIMMQDLLDFVKGRKGENYNYQELDLDKFIEYLKQLFFDYTSRFYKIENIFNFDIENINNFRIKIDLIRFKRVYFNLLKNAYEACVASNKKSIKINTFLKIKDNNELEIEVQDNGIGIPEENIDKLFQTFFTSGKKEGTGLGLAISKNIINNFGGNITVKSIFGEGTSFFINLPLIQKQQ